MKTLQDYINLAEKTKDELDRVHCDETAMDWFEKYANAGDSEVNTCLMIIPAMAKALIEAEQLVLAASTMLSKPRMIGRENEEMDMAKSMLDKALSQIQALNGGGA